MGFFTPKAYYDDKGNRTVITKDGVTTEKDPAFSQKDMDAYNRGEITDVEYRRRYNARHRSL